jgi:dienelactone hydrolase
MTDRSELRIRGSERRAAAIVEDVTYPGDDGEPVEAYLVRPADDTARGPGLVAWHWLDDKAPDGDRSQFVGEAVDLAGLGIVSLLPQGRFPWRTAPSSAAADSARIREEVARLRRGLGLVASHPQVEQSRLGLVGHDFGGMLAILAAADDDRVRSLAVIAPTPRWGDWFLPFWQIEDDRIDYLRAMRPLDPIERIGNVAPARLLLQFGRRDFYIALMQAHELRREAPDGSQFESYDAEHDMRLPEIAADRRAFLASTLGPGG